MATPRAQLVVLPRQAASALPHYEMRAKRHQGADMALEIWQLPAAATPHIKQPTYVAGLHDRNLSLVEHHLLRRLKALRINLHDLPAIEAMTKKEAGYWLGMAMHRKYPRRVLMALRFLLIDPHA